MLNNDMSHPVHVAWEAATIHELSGGRFELGLGASHTAEEYPACGIDFDTLAQPRPPVLVGGKGTALPRHADIIGVQGLGRTMADGHRH